VLDSTKQKLYFPG